MKKLVKFISKIIKVKKSVKIEIGVESKWQQC